MTLFKSSSLMGVDRFDVNDGVVVAMIMLGASHATTMVAIVGRDRGRLQAGIVVFLIREGEQVARRLAHGASSYASSSASRATRPQFEGVLKLGFVFEMIAILPRGSEVILFERRGVRVFFESSF